MTETNVPTGFLRFRGDLFGGVTAGVVALPLALAFGVASGLGPAAGLYGAIAVGFFAAVFGGTPAQVSGPTGPMTVVVAELVALGTHSPPMIHVAIMMSGVLQIAFGALRLGGFIRYVPYPVVSGFMSGIGVIIVTLQALPLLGVKGKSAVIDSLQAMPGALGHINPAALAIGLAAVGIVYGTKAVAPRVPGALVALVATTLAAWLLQLDVPRIGAIPTGLPDLRLPPLDVHELVSVLPAAIMLAALASIDSLLTSLVADNLTRTRHDSNRELVGQGIGNTVAGLIGGIPGAGATMRTVVNIQAGGRTPLSGATHAVLLLAVMLGLAPLAAQVPLAALAGILVTVGIGILDMRGLRHIRSVPKSDAVVMATVLLMTVFVDLIQAVAVGMVMACLIFAKRIGDLEVARPTAVEGTGALPVDDAAVPSELAHVEAGQVWVVPITGVVFFGNASPLSTTLTAIEDARAVVLDLAGAPFLDQSGAYAIGEAAKDLEARGVTFHVAGLSGQPARLMARTGIVPGQVPAARVHETVDAAVAAATSGPPA